MLRRLSKWGVTLLGVLLLAWGAAAMWNGWDVIQIERGWSLFIGGASALAGGAVTFALALVIGRLDRLIAAATPTPDAPLRKEAGGGEAVKSPPPPKPAKKAAESAKTAANVTSSALASAPADAAASWARRVAGKRAGVEDAQPNNVATGAAERKSTEPNNRLENAEAEATRPSPFDTETDPAEVDRYESGETTYVMFSDGSVEVRTPLGARRYASLGELRAQAAQQI